jgi:CHAD domain-containing protein
LHLLVVIMAEIGIEAGVSRDETALASASKLFVFLWSEAWRSAPATVQGDAEALHDMRVALRRLRTGLQNFEGEGDAPILSPHLRRELKSWRGAIGKLGDRLGAVRDFDVLADYVRDFAKDAGSPGLQKFEAALAHERKKNFAPMTRKIERAGQPNRLREEFARWALGLPGAYCAAQLSTGEAANHILPARLDEALALGNALTEGDEEAQHELRRTLRRIRYTLETLSPCFDKQVKKPVKRLVELQDKLGEMQDRIVLQEWLAHSFKDMPDDVKALSQHGMKRREELLEEVRALWQKRAREGLWDELKALETATSS